MRHLFLANTPAHVHLYRNAVAELSAAGEEVFVLARDYGCTVALAEHYDLLHAVYGRCGTTVGSLARQLPGQLARVATRARRFDPDLVFGVGAYAAVAAAASRTPAVLVLDSEPTGLDHAVSRPFARTILTPAAFRKDLGEGHYVFDGFGECAYLHPDRFTPDPSVRADLGVGPDERVALVRLNAFGSSHDLGEGGFTPAQRRTLVERLAEHATVLVSDEGGDLDLSTLPARPFDCHPARLHDALAAADLLVADSQTVVTEAALVGTPAVRSNSFVGPEDMGNFVELARLGLVENCARFEAALDTAVGLLTDPDAGDRWARRRDRYVTDTADLTGLLTAVARQRGHVDGVEGLRPSGARPGASGPAAAADD
jgi:predicted glycosyltransferase